MTYQALVRQRQVYSFSKGLINPATLADFEDVDHLDAWGSWQANLKAPLLILGQDWGTTDYFLRYHQGPDQNATNQNLRFLLKSRGLDPGLPSQPMTQNLFFTNVILAPYAHSPGHLPVAWLREGLRQFILPLIEMLNPCGIITLGRIPYQALRLESPQLPALKLSHLVQQSLSFQQIPLWPMYHCGGLGLAQRSLAQQTADWRRILLP